MRGLTAVLLATLVVLSLGKPVFADLIISSSDPNFNSSVSSSPSDTGFFVLVHNSGDHFSGDSFTVAQTSTLDSVVANLSVNSANGTATITAQLLELGAPENDQFGTPSYQYTLLGSSTPIVASGNGTSYSEQTLSFSGEELDPGNTYLITLSATVPTDGGFIDWEFSKSPASDFATPLGSIGQGTWDYTTASDQTSLVYLNVPDQTPELTINAMIVPEPSSLALIATGAVSLLTYARVRRRSASVAVRQ